MMEIPNSNNLHSRRHGEDGQVMLLVVLVLSLFLLAGMAFAVDVSNIWFHRQVAQDAADAACTAGAMDMLAMAQGGSAPKPNFTPGNAIDCSSTTPNTDPAAAPVPCWYASKDGYPSSGLVADTPSNEVKISFPSSVSGYTNPPTSLFSGSAPYIQVNVIDRVQTFFMGLLSGKKTMDVGALATCGGQLASSPLPIVVLNPTQPSTLNLNGTPSISIYGGPQRSVEVNSRSASAVSPGGTIDLHLGGPNNTGSDFGVFGGSPQCCNFNGGTTGHWDIGSAIADPLSGLVAPTQTGLTTRAGPYQHVTDPVNGCPDPSRGCDEYAGGYYPGGIDIKNVTAIFDPGIYYVVGLLHLESNSTVRPSDSSQVPGDGSGGTIFFMVPPNPLAKCSGINSSTCIDSNSGKSPACTTAGINSPNGCVDSFQLSQLRCTATSTVPGSPPLPASGVVDGNVFMAPCSGTYGDPLGGTEPGGEQRGILFFQDRATSAGISGQFGGGGSLLMAGTMYFHQCVTSGADTGTGCLAPTDGYNATLSLGGNSGSATYVLGSIIVDQLDMHGTPDITMDLNSNDVKNVLKVSLLR